MRTNPFIATMVIASIGLLIAAFVILNRGTTSLALGNSLFVIGVLTGIAALHACAVTWVPDERTLRQRITDRVFK